MRLNKLRRKLLNGVTQVHVDPTPRNVVSRLQFSISFLEKAPGTRVLVPQYLYRRRVFSAEWQGAAYQLRWTRAPKNVPPLVGGTFFGRGPTITRVETPQDFSTNCSSARKTTSHAESGSNLQN